MNEAFIHVKSIKLCKKSLEKYDYLDQTTRKCMMCFSFRFLKEMIHFRLHTVMLPK